MKAKKPLRICSVSDAHKLYESFRQWLERNPSLDFDVIGEEDRAVHSQIMMITTTTITMRVDKLMFTI